MRIFQHINHIKMYTWSFQINNFLFKKNVLERQGNKKKKRIHSYNTTLENIKH